MEWPDVVGGVSILVGILLYLWRNKRRFDRTNSAGIEQFRSYDGKLAAKLGDTSRWLLSVSGIMFGVSLLAQAHEKNWGGVVLALFFGWLFIGVFFRRSK